MLSLFPSFAENVPILVPLELLSLPLTCASSGVMSDISPLYLLITTGVSSSPSRITVPPSPAQRRSNVPYQMLLLLEKMQCGKCKAVGPTDLAYCLSEHRVKCKQPCLMPTSVCIIQHIQAVQTPTAPSGIEKCQELGA